MNKPCHRPFRLVSRASLHLASLTWLVAAACAHPHGATSSEPPLPQHEQLAPLDWAALQVLSVASAEEPGPRAPVQVIFSQALVGLGERPEDVIDVQLEPAVAGHWQWSGADVMTFVPDEDWRLGANYRLHLKAQQHAVTWQEEIDVRPRTLEISELENPWQDQRLRGRAPLALQFSEAIDLAQLQTHLKVIARVQGEAPRELALELSRPLAPEQAQPPIDGPIMPFVRSSAKTIWPQPSLHYEVEKTALVLPANGEAWPAPAQLDIRIDTGLTIFGQTPALSREWQLLRHTAPAFAVMGVRCEAVTRVGKPWRELNNDGNWPAFPHALPARESDGQAPVEARSEEVADDVRKIPAPVKLPSALQCGQSQSLLLELGQAVDPQQAQQVVVRDAKGKVVARGQATPATIANGTLHISGVPADGGDYSLEIPAGLKANDGQVLARGHRMTVQSRASVKDLHLALYTGDGRWVPGTGGQALIAAQGVQQVELSLVELSPQQVAAWQKLTEQPQAAEAPTTMANLQREWATQRRVSWRESLGGASLGSRTHAWTELSQRLAQVRGPVLVQARCLRPVPLPVTKNGLQPADLQAACQEVQALAVVQVSASSIVVIGSQVQSKWASDGRPQVDATAWFVGQEGAAVGSPPPSAKKADLQGAIDLGEPPPLRQQSVGLPPCAVRVATDARDVWTDDGQACVERLAANFAQGQVGEAVAGRWLVERPLYQPGDELHLMAWFWVHSPQSAKGVRALPTAAREVALELIREDGQSAAVAVVKVKVGDHGEASAKLTLPSDLAPGRYTWRLQQGDPSWQVRGEAFWVQKASLPEVAWELKAVDPTAKAAKSWTLAARWLSGEPARLRTVEPTLRCEPQPLTFNEPHWSAGIGRDEGKFITALQRRFTDLRSEVVHALQVPVAVVRAGQDANAPVKLDPEWQRLLANQAYTCNLNVLATTSHLESSEVHETTQVEPSQPVLALRLTTTDREPHEPLEVQLKSRQGQAFVAFAGETIGVRAFSVGSWQPWNLSDRWLQEIKELDSCTWRAAKGATVRCKLDVGAAARVALVVTRNDRVETVTMPMLAYWGGDDPATRRKAVTVAWSRSDGTKLDPQRDVTAKVGETLHLALSSPRQEGWGEIILAHGEVRQRLPFVLKNGQAKISWQAAAGDYPEVAVGGWLTFPAKGGHRPITLELAWGKITVQHAARELGVAIDLPATGAPGQPVKAKIKVTQREEGKAAKLFVWGYDQALDVVREPGAKAAPTFDLFDRSLHGGYINARGNLWWMTGGHYPRDAAILYQADHGFEGAAKDMRHASAFGGNFAANGATPQVRRQQDVRRALVFAGPLDTNAQGEAIVEFKLPAQLSAFTVQALATALEPGDTLPSLVGYGEHRLATQRELAVRVQAPDVLRPGDRSEIAVLVKNGRTSALSLRVDAVLPTGQGLRLLAVPNALVNLAPGEEKAVHLPVQSEPDAGDAADVTLRVTLSTPDRAQVVDAYEMPLRLRWSPPLPYHDAQYRELRDDMRHTVALSPNTDVDWSRARVSVTLADAMQGTTDDLVELLAKAPFDALEAALAHWIAARAKLAVQQAKTPADRQALEQARAAVQAAGEVLQRLYQDQGSAAGFVRFPGGSIDGQPDFSSALAMWVILEANELARQVAPPRKDARGQREPHDNGLATEDILPVLPAIRANLGQRLEHSEAVRPWDQLARGELIDLALTLAATSLSDPATAKSLMSRRWPEVARGIEHWPYDVLSLLWLSASRVKVEAERLAVLEKALFAGLRANAHSAFLVAPSRVRQSERDRSNRSSQAWLMIALLAQNPQHPALLRVSAGLRELRYARDPAAVVGNLVEWVAWSHYFEERRAQAIDSEVVVRLAGQEIARDRVISTAGQPAPLIVRHVDLSRWPGHGENAPLTIESRGKGIVDVRVAIAGPRRSDERVPREHGLQIACRVRPINGTNRIVAGEPLALDLEVHSAIDLRGLATEIHLPGGLQAVALGQREMRMQAMQATGVRLPDGLSIHGERVVAYLNAVHPGTQTFSVLVTSRVSGDFLWPACRAFALDAPETWGTAAAGRVVIEAANP